MVREVLEQIAELAKIDPDKVLGHLEIDIQTCAISRNEKFCTTIDASRSNDFTDFAAEVVRIWKLSTALMPAEYGAPAVINIANQKFLSDCDADRSRASSYLKV